MKMMTCAVALAAAGLLSTPAAARDGQPYVGVELGAWIVEDIHGETEGDFGGGGGGPVLLAVDDPSPEGINADLKTGVDVDLIAGYDFGWVRTEAELAYKRARFNEVAVGEDLFFAGEHDSDGSLKAWSLAANILADIPLGGGWNVYAGPGFGWAWLDVHPKVDLNGGGTSKLNDEKEDGFLLQGIAGVRKSMTDNLDFGLKYRYVRSKRESFDSGFYGDIRGRVKSHSLLASLIYNFGAPRPVAAPVAPAVQPAPMVEPAPAPMPAMQTCPDGTMIEASATCPPAPAPVERG